MELKRPHAVVQFVRRFSPTPMRSKAFAFEEALTPLIKAPVNVLPAQSALPTQPRFVMSDEKRSFAASDTSTTLELNYDSTVLKANSLSHLLERPAEILDKLDKNYDPDAKRFYAVVIMLNYPYVGRQRDISDKVVQTMYSERVVSPDEIEAFTFNYLKVVEPFQKIFELSQYRYYESLIQSTGGFVHFDADFETPSQEGLQVKIDVSSKRFFDYASPRPFSEALESAIEFLRAELPPSLGVELPSL